MIYNLEAEQSLLWSILIDNDVLQDIEINSEDFLDIKNELIYWAIVNLKKVQLPIDIITVKDKLEKSWELQQAWWIVYLTELTSFVPNTSNAKEYNTIIKDYSNKRKLSNLAQNIQLNISKWENWETIVWAIHNLTNNLEWISRDKDMNDVYEETLELITTLQKQETSLIWYSFWKEFDWIDKATGWIIAWKIYRLWGRSNVWKSWLLYNFIISVLWQGARVTFFALENDELFTMKNLFWLKWGKNTLPHILQENQDIKFDKEAVWFSNKKFRVETRYKTLSSIFRKALKNKSDIIFIDYIQAFKAEWKYTSKDAKFEDYAFQIQGFATKYNIAVFDLSQLSNEVKRWWIQWWWADEFKWSSALKESADVWLHIFEWVECADWYLNNRTIKLTKNRLWPWVWTKMDYIMNFHKWGKWLKDI